MTVLLYKCLSKEIFSHLSLFLQFRRFRPFTILMALVCVICSHVQAIDEEQLRKSEQPLSQGSAQGSLSGSTPIPLDASRGNTLQTLNTNNIDAEEFPVTIQKSSTSKLVLMLSDPLNNEPRPGKILLIKKDQEEMMAIRVLKNYPVKFAAKIVMKFRDFDLDVQYRAIKKLNDRLLEKINKRERLLRDEGITDDELAKEIDPSDIELDRGISAPKPKKKIQKKKEDLSQDSPILKEDDDANLSDFTHTEDTQHEPYNHILSAQLGLLLNYNSLGERKYYTGAGIKYGYNFARRMIINGPKFQDMITVELGLNFYRIIGFALANDEVNVVPISCSFRYGFFASENLFLYLYAGAIKNNAFTSSIPAPNLTLLNRVAPAAGGGALIRIGPGWSIRLDAGYEAFLLGASLRF